MNPTKNSIPRITDHQPQPFLMSSTLWKGMRVEKALEEQSTQTQKWSSVDRLLIGGFYKPNNENKMAEGFYENFSPRFEKRRRTSTENSS
ncbi:hypothetical protein ACTXT7_002447 [Hymenolepis weldensis]